MSIDRPYLVDLYKILKRSSKIFEIFFNSNKSLMDPNNCTAGCTNSLIGSNISVTAPPLNHKGGWIH